LPYFRFTLARSVDPYEPPAADTLHQTLQFELEQARQKTRRLKTRSLGDRIQIAGLSGCQAGQHRIHWTNLAGYVS
jgi:hypothetical protein